MYASTVKSFEKANSNMYKKHRFNMSSRSCTTKNHMKYEYYKSQVYSKPKLY